jgi:threonylcarbamoyladenosine tRNA methylthiotransferase MtaB
VLWEHATRSGEYSGYTPDYIRVYARSDCDITNTISPVRLAKLYRDGAWCEIIDSEENR